MFDMPTNKSYAKLPYIPIMFKAYPGGKFTAKMVKGPVEKVVISESKGEGLQLSHTKPGKIVMVIGGTGLYPFSDFIDLLYKEQLMIHKPETRNEVLELSPVLSSNPFSKLLSLWLALSPSSRQRGSSQLVLLKTMKSSLLQL